MGNGMGNDRGKEIERPLRRYRGVIAGVLALAMLVSSAGCFGSFRVLKSVHKFNKEVNEEKFVQELVFLVLVIIPVYSVATLADAIVVNSIEFWTGENPIADPSVRVFESEDGVARIQRLDADRLRVDVTRVDGTTESFTLQKSGTDVRAIDDAGEVIACATTRDGRPVLLPAGH